MNNNVLGWWKQNIVCSNINQIWLLITWHTLIMIHEFWPCIVSNVFLVQTVYYTYAVSCIIPLISVQGVTGSGITDCLGSLLFYHCDNCVISRSYFSPNISFRCSATHMYTQLLIVWKSYDTWLSSYSMPPVI